MTHSPTRTFTRLPVTAVRLWGRTVRYGLVDFFLNPAEARSFWRRVASAAWTPSPSSLQRNGQAHIKINMEVPKQPLAAIMPKVETTPATLVDYVYTQGDVPVQEQLILSQLVRWQNPKIVFEIGTFMGGTTLQLAANSEAQVYTLDLPPSGYKDYVQNKVWDPKLDVYPDQPGVRFQGSPYADRIQQLFGDSQTYDFTPYYGSVDFTFVDACHHYEFALRDGRNALKMMSPGGIVIWHDYGSYAPGVVQALNELSKEVPLIHIAGTCLVIHHQSELNS